jgi:hypothetical protein
MLTVNETHVSFEQIKALTRLLALSASGPIKLIDRLCVHVQIMDTTYKERAISGLQLRLLPVHTVCVKPEQLPKY